MLRFKIFIFIIIITIAFGIIGGFAPAISGFCFAICKICGVIDVLFVLYIIFEKMFGNDI